MNLFEKYNIPAPRYTSYPTVPYWENTPSQDEWKRQVKKTFDETNSSEGISLYIHLPYCESLCTYCACNTRITVNHAVEGPYIEAVLKEWKMYLSAFAETPRIREIHLGGGTPTFFSPANLEILISEIIEAADICPDAEFSFEAHPNNTTEKHLEVLYGLGFRRISLGIQDFDEKVQKAIHRMQSFEQVKKITESARRIGYASVNYDLIFGLPFQNKKSIAKTIEQVCTLKPERIAFYSYAHVPWLKPGQRGYSEKDLPEGKEKRKLYEEGKRIFLENGYEDIGLDHFALPHDELLKASKEKRMHRNFMGYTSRHTKLLVGLGVSAISDAGGALVQNAKTVENYFSLVEKEIFPFEKGHVLTEQDFIFKKIILDLMCNLETTIDYKTNQAVYPCIVRTLPMEEDGLINSFGGKIFVTEKGKAFLRNICLCFDIRYWNKIPDKKIFSQAV